MRWHSESDDVANHGVERKGSGREIAAVIAALGASFILATILVAVFYEIPNSSEPDRAAVKVEVTETHLLLPGKWRHPLVRFTFEGCQFMGVQTGTSLTCVWHSPQCPCGK